MGGLERNSLTLVKASSHSLVHSNFSFFLIEAKKANALSPAHDRILDKAAILPVSCCTSLMLQGLLMLMMACHLSTLASIPRLVSKNPETFLPEPQKCTWLGSGAC